MTRQRQKREKKQRDIGKIGVKIMAAILAALMVLSVAASLIYYLVSMAN